MSIDWRSPMRNVKRTSAQIRADVEEELRFHLEMRVRELQAQGLSAVAARELAQRQFGDIEAAREVCVGSDLRREHQRAWLVSWDELRQDVRQGVRQLRRRWSVTLVAALTLGVGIGASTAIFSATDHVLLRPLPYPESDRVMTIWETNLREGQSKLEVSSTNFIDWQRRNRTFEVLGLVEPFSFDLETADGPPQAVSSWLVTQGFLEALGVKPILGRVFEARDYEKNAAPVAMISQNLWQTRFGSDPRVVGKTIRLDGRNALVVGVLPASLKYPNSEDIWSPKFFRDEELTSDRTSNYMYAVGRLKAGVTREQAAADLQRVARDLATEYPVTNKDLSTLVVPLEEQILGNVKPALLVMLGAVAFVLLIACANVASLLLAAGAERGRELAVRASLGAGRARLVWQMITESGLLALVGGVFGLVIARLTLVALKTLSPPNLPRVEDIALDGRVLAFAIALTVATAVLFGLAPALRFSRPDLLTTLRASGRSLTSGPDRNRLRGLLVVGEVSLALVLLIGAGLLMRSFVTLVNNPLGFEPQNRATLQTFLWDRNATAELREQRVSAILDAFRNTPGVVQAGVVSALPFHPHAINADNKLRIAHRPKTDEQLPTVFTTIASPDYFKTMGIPLLRGRSFDERDRAGGAVVALINETLAERYFPGEDPIGKFVNIGVMSRPVDMQIVGVVGDVRPVSLESEPKPELFVPYAQYRTGSVTFVVQTARDAGQMMPLLREKFWSVDRGQSIYLSATIEELIGDTLVERRFHLILLAAFSAIALILATIGIYGLLSFATQQRTSEIGVRMAVGAERGQIISMIVGNGLRLVLPGIALGIIGALVLTRFLQGMLYGVEATDPITFAQITLLMIAVAALAAYVPARRAVRGSPLRNILNE